MVVAYWQAVAQKAALNLLYPTNVTDRISFRKKEIKKQRRDFIGAAFLCFKMPVCRFE
jgi:hypothetical protein